MGAILHYTIAGTFISTGVILAVTFVIIFDVINGINEFQRDVEKDLDQFKVRFKKGGYGTGKCHAIR